MLSFLSLRKKEKAIFWLFAISFQNNIITDLPIQTSFFWPFLYE
jgi:hypothetical protein